MSGMLELLLMGVLIMIGRVSAVYMCPTSCQLPQCQCASTDIPGNLAPQDTPQFVSITFDDGINDNTWTVMEPILRETVANDSLGCLPKSNMFLTSDYADYTLAQKMAFLGHEISSHTVSHSTGFETTAQEWAKELRLSKKFIEKYANLPPGSVRGMRAPFLAHNPAMWSGMETAGILWDSSIAEYYGWQYLADRSTGMTWPYTVDYGVPTSCNEWDPCIAPQTVRGLWEVPMYALQYPGSAILLLWLKLQ
jgi:peptidoglycan/xylan/chitin deacetylase (PgdA/CDA1 family)